MLALLTLLRVLAAADPALDPSPAPGINAAPAVEALTATDDTKGLRATFLVGAPPAVVLDTLWDVTRFRQIFPDIEKLEVLAERPGSVDARFTVDAVLAKVSYTLRRDVDRASGTVRWQAIDGDLKSVRGSWQVSATDDPRVARVTYTSFVDVGYAVPSGLVRDTALRKVDEMAGRVRGACRTALLASR